MMDDPYKRAVTFSKRFGLRLPILLAPMAGACPPSASIAVMRAGGMGACGALLLSPNEMAAWAAEVRGNAAGPFQINLWIPEPPPVRDRAHESRVREFLGRLGPPVPEVAGDISLPNFEEQCQTLLQIKPAAVSSIMGLYPPDFVAELKSRGIAWFATATTVAEAKRAEAAGADAIIAQGMEAGGHRGAFDATKAVEQLVGLFSLLPAVANAVRIPLLAAGGIADGRGVAAALLLGASAVVMGTAFLRSPESGVHSAWVDALGKAAPEETIVSRVFTGKPARSLATDYARAALAPGAPKPAPYPVQRGLTRPMTTQARQEGDVQRMQAWAGQSAALGQAEPAGDIVERVWKEATALMRSG